MSSVFLPAIDKSQLPVQIYGPTTGSFSKLPPNVIVKILEQVNPNIKSNINIFGETKLVRWEHELPNKVKEIFSSVDSPVEKIKSCKKVLSKNEKKKLWKSFCKKININHLIYSTLVEEIYTIARTCKAFYHATTNRRELLDSFKNEYKLRNIQRSIMDGKWAEINNRIKNEHELELEPTQDHDKQLEGALKCLQGCITALNDGFDLMHQEFIINGDNQIDDYVESRILKKCKSKKKKIKNFENEMLAHIKSARKKNTEPKVDILIDKCDKKMMQLGIKRKADS